MCQNAHWYVPKCRKSVKMHNNFATCKWSGGGRDSSMVQNRKLLVHALLKHRLRGELSHRSAHCCDNCSDKVTQTMLCSNQAGTLLPRKNQWTQYKNILPWKRSPPAQMVPKCKWGQLSEITPLMHSRYCIVGSAYTGQTIMLHWLQHTVDGLDKCRPLLSLSIKDHLEQTMFAREKIFAWQNFMHICVLC